jgi:hypothetical protein
VPSLAAWTGPFGAVLSQTAVDALEAGRVVVLPDLAFPMQADEATLMTPDLPEGRRKNISFDAVAGRVSGSPVHAEQTARTLRRFAADADRLLRSLLVPYANSLSLGRTSFRPAEIAGRTYSPGHDDRRLHVDAFPSQPLRGQRILRLFSNVSPAGRPREWRVGERFEDVAARFLRALPPPSPTRARLCALLGLTRGVRSPHDRMKLDPAYQGEAAFVPWRFDPGTTWLCFTDQVPHAAVSGHLTLEQTFYLLIQAMVDPGRSPLRVLERQTGRVLAD